MPVPTQPTLIQMRQRALNLVSEAANTEGGALPSGSGGTDTANTDDFLTYELNQAKNIIAREAWPLRAFGQVTFPGNQQVLGFAEMSTADGSTIINCLRVSGPGGPLRLSDFSFLSINTPPGSPIPYADASGVPLYWYREGNSGIGIAPYPTADTVLNISAYYVPADMVGDSDTAAWLAPDLVRVLVFYAAAMYAKKNTNDNSLAAYSDIWMGEFDRMKQQLQSAFVAANPKLAELLIGVGGK